MRHSRPILLILSLLPLFTLLHMLCACGERRPAPVPRPVAYQRINLYPQQYDTVIAGALPLMINSSATLRQSSPARGVTHLSALYPRYGATLHVTAIRCADGATDSLLALRRQRMEVNLGDAEAKASQTASPSGRFGATLLRARPDCPSPLQLLAVAAPDAADSTDIIAATLFLATPGQQPDSLRPVIDALQTDMLRLLDRL